jgi:hypothetical protein
MGYNIEVSFNTAKHSNVSEFKKDITDLAIEFNCDHYYYLYEMEGNTKIPRNHCIIVINFSDEETFSCAIFLKKIKRHKTRGIYIECIYDDNIECNLLYASQYYLTTIDKENVIKYNKNKRERSLSDNDKTVLEPIITTKK